MRLPTMAGGFIEAGHVDPHRLRFVPVHVRRIEEAAADAAREIDNVTQGQYAAVFRDHEQPRTASACRGRKTAQCRSPIRLLVAALLVAGAFACGTRSGRDAAPPSVPTPTTPHLYELRIYTAASGKMDALHARFRDHTLRLFEKHGIRSVAYWTGIDEGQREKLYYVIAYPDRAAREQRLINGIAKDPEFLKAVAESEKGGKLTSGVESILLAPTDYSPIR